MLEKLGLVKLTEECGELIQVACKKMACMDTDTHWDGAGSLKERLEDEAADVIAIITVVRENFDLDGDRMVQRIDRKIELFRQWMQEAQTEPPGASSEKAEESRVIDPEWKCERCGNDLRNCLCPFDQALAAPPTPAAREATTTRPMMLSEIPGYALNDGCSAGVAPTAPEAPAQEPMPLHIRATYQPGNPVPLPPSPAREQAR